MGETFRPRIELPTRELANLSRAAAVTERTPSGLGAISVQSVSAVPVCVLQNSGQNIGTGSWTALQWNIEVDDDWNMHAGSATSPIIKPTWPGRYIIVAKPVFTYSTSGAGRSCSLGFNGTIYGAVKTLPPSATGWDHMVDLSQVVTLDGVNDYLEVWVAHDAAGPLAMSADTQVEILFAGNRNT